MATCSQPLTPDTPGARTVTVIEPPVPTWTSARLLELRPGTMSMVEWADVARPAGPTTSEPFNHGSKTEIASSTDCTPVAGGVGPPPIARAPATLT